MVMSATWMGPGDGQDRDLLVRVQQRATKMIRGLEYCLMRRG